MTKKELSQLYWLNREIEMDTGRLRELEAMVSSPKAQKLDGTPHTAGYGDALARCVAEIVGLKAIIAAKQQQCIYERNRLERYIAGIPDSLTRQIFTLRFINGLSWYQVAAHIGGGNTDDSVRICRPCSVFSCYLGSDLSSKGKSRFFIYEFETLKNGVWAAKKPDKIGLFAGYIFFVPF